MSVAGELAGLASGYGGIGGGYSTLKLTVSLPPGTVVVGSNMVSFRFNKGDGRSTAVRHAELCFQDAGTSALQRGDPLCAGRIPGGWGPAAVASDPADLAAGKSLWVPGALLLAGGSPSWPTALLATRRTGAI